MPDIVANRFYITEYQEYECLIQCVIELLIQAKKGNKIKFWSNIDEEIAYLFNTNNVFAGKLRKFYYPDESKKQKLSKECLNEGIIGHFDFNRLKIVLRKYHIEISDEMDDTIRLLSACALPVSEILNQKSEFEIHTNFKTNLKEWIDEIDIIMKQQPNLQVAMFKYLHRFRDNELVWWLLTVLPSIDKARVKKWTNTFRNVPSEKTILELIDSTEELGYLLDFKNKIRRINRNNHKNIYEDVTGFDLLSAYLHIDNFKQLACNPLRPEDIYLTYLIAATIKQSPQELILEQIGAATKIRLPIDFTPAKEIRVDWNTRTYFYNS